MMFITVFAVLLFSNGVLLDVYMKDRTYVELFKDEGNGQCRRCLPGFCNIIVLPSPNSKEIDKFERAEVFQEVDKDGNDNCRCDDIPNIYRKKRRNSCDGFVNYCEFPKKVWCTGSDCITQRSTFYCSCAVPAFKPGYVGQRCDWEIGPLEKSKTHYPPGLLDLLNLPRTFEIDRVTLSPAIYIVVAPNENPVTFGYQYEGRYVKVPQNVLQEVRDVNALIRRINTIKNKIPFAVLPQAYTWIMEQVNTWGTKVINIHPLFLDHRIRIELDAADNVIPTNKGYKWRSIGRVATYQVYVFSVPVKYWLPTWNFGSRQIFVPYERAFLPCSYKLTMTLRTVKCSDDINKPTMVAVHRPLKIVAGREPWFDNGEGLTSCHMKIVDHRWKLLKTTATIRNGDHRQYHHLPDDMNPLKSTYSSGKDSDGEKSLDSRSFMSRPYPKSQLYLLIYDLVQEGHPDFHATGFEFQQRKLCYLRLPKDKELTVHPAVKVDKKTCLQSHEILMINDEPAVFPNEDIEVSWVCSYDGNKPCKSVTTTGIQSYFTDELVCDSTYVLNLTIYFAKDDPSIALTKLDQVVITSAALVPDIHIECQAKCDHTISIGDTIKLIATEEPATNTPWKWAMYNEVLNEEGVTRTEVSESLMAQARRQNTPPNVFVLHLLPLFSKDSYTITAGTKYGVQSYSIRLNRGPLEGRCAITPYRGRMGDPVFTVTCKDWKKGFLPLTFRVVEEYPLSTYPVTTSLDEVMPNLRLYHTNLSVIITDSRDGYTENKLVTIMLDSCDKVSDPEFQRYLDRINVKLLGNEDNEALDLMGELARKMAATETIYRDSRMILLMEALGRVGDLESPLILHRGMAILNRITDSKIPPESLKTDEVLLAATERFIDFSEAVAKIVDSDGLNGYDKDKIITSMTHGASLIMNLRDRVTENDLLEEDEHERHLQRAKHSTVAVLESMESIARALAREVNTTLQPYEMDIGGMKMLVTVKNLTELQKDMKKLEEKSHTFKFLPDTIGRHGGTEVSLTKLSSKNNSMFWFLPDNDAGVMDIVLKSQNHSLEIAKEPVSIAMKLSDMKQMEFKGILMPTPVCPSRHKRDRSVSVHQLKLPDGEGAVLMFFPESLKNKAMVVFKQGSRPTFENFNNVTPLSGDMEPAKYHNLDEAKESDFYIGFIPLKTEKVPKRFSFNVTIVRCAIWVGEQFVSRGCKFQKIVADKVSSTVWCLCNHQSWFSSGFFLPPHKIVLTDDIQLFSAIFDNAYVPILVLTIIFFLIAVLLWGYRKDRKDVAERNIQTLEDNYPGEMYPYVVAVFTGERFGSGTSSRVAIRLFGDAGSHSRVHMLESSKRNVLQLGSDNWFMLKTAKSLGKVKAIQLWHNHTGSHPEWYCRRVIIYDITTEQTFEFMVERWFTFDASVSVEEARMFEGTVATDEEISKKWYYHITGWTFSELRDKHHWASIFTRHPRSLYTRCQRAMIAVGLLTTTMLISMMFFDISTTGPADIPAPGFSFEEFWVGIKSTFFSIILTTAVLWCFQKSKKTEVTEIRKLQEAKEEEKEEKKKLAFKQKIIMKIQKMATNKIKPEPVLYQAVTFGEQEQPKKKFSVRFFLVLGWIISTVTLLFVSFFIIFYGLKFGVKKSLVWMLTFISGTVSDTAIMEPLKMIFLAVVVSVLFKKSNIDNFTMKVKYTPQPETSETKLEKLRKNFQLRVMSHYHPCLSEWITRRRKSVYRRDYKYLCVYAIFYSLMLILVGMFLYAISVEVEYFYLRQLGYHFKETMHPDFEDSSKVISESSMYNFFHRTAIPALHRVLWYNNKSLPLEKGEIEPISDKPRFTSYVKGFAQGYCSKLLGVPRLRQMRNRRESLYAVTVDKLFRRLYPTAVGGYLSIWEDRKSYLPMWKPYDGSLGNITQLWTFTPPYDTGTIFGKSLTPYGGGGYFRFLDWNLGGSLRQLQYLEMNKWVDNYTRVIFLEMNLFNNNLKLFSTVRLLTEALPCGFYSFRVQLQTASFFFEKKPESKAIIGLMFILALLLIGYGLFCFIQFSRVGFFNYMMTFRGACDILLLIVGIMSISNYLQRALHFALFIEYLDSSPHDKFISLYTPFQSDETAHNVFGLFTMVFTVSMGVNAMQLISFGRFRWVFAKVATVLSMMVLLNGLFTLLLTFLSETIDSNGYDYFIFQFTFKHERLTSYRSDENSPRWLFLMCFPIAIGLLKFNLAAVIYFYNTLDQKPTTALAVVHGDKNIAANRQSKKPMKTESRRRTTIFSRKLPPGGPLSDTPNTLQKKIDNLLI